MAFNINAFANPKRFMWLSALLLPWAVALCVITTIAGLYFALFHSPADYQQGETVRIMYIHVPAATMSISIYVAMAMASAMGLIWKHPLSDLAAKCMSPIGAAFTFLALVTGSFWGKPMWGTWWVWDARLTSELLLLFLFMGHMALLNAFDDPARGAKSAGILCIVGVINVPIIKFSVDWWNTLHQPASLMKSGGPSIHPDMLIPLGLMWLCFLSYFTVVLFIRMRGEIIASKVRALRLRQVHG
ncbi:MAG: heme ABC transporter permease [Methylocystaceae bacterium]|nr:heme ABC transporter permease [Methylocystaceae bacterium]